MVFCHAWHQKNQFTLTFDLVDGNLPLIVGMDISKFSNICNRRRPRTITFKRSVYLLDYTLRTYIHNGASDNSRMSLGLVSKENATLPSLMDNVSGRKYVNVVKRVIRFGYAAVEEMKELSQPTGFVQIRMVKESQKVYDACEIFASTSRTED